MAAVPQMGGFYPNGFFEGDSLLQRSSGAGASYHTVQLVQPAATFYGDQYNILTVSFANISPCSSSLQVLQKVK